MEKPKCSICHHRHYSYEPHIWSSSDKAGPDEVIEGIASRGKTANHRPQPVGGVTAKASGVVPDGCEVGASRAEQSAETNALKMEQARKPLTPAEKQKAYRERHKEEYRRRNRERMRKKRNG